MGLLMKISPILTLVFIFVLIGFFSNEPSLKAQTFDSTVSTVYVSPLTTCCGGMNAPYQPGDTFSVSVNLNLVAGQTINGFDVRLNYTKPHSGVQQGVLQALSIDYSGNMLSSYGTTVPIQCVDGLPVPSTGSGCSDEGLGQVHLAELVLGSTLVGPITGTLFRITLKVWGSGTSLFAFDRANIPNPTPDPSNPSLINVQYIPMLKEDAVFGNSGVVAFFNFQPRDPTISTALLPNQPVIFDAGASFVPISASMSFRWYLWDFGDGTLVQNVTQPSTSHLFAFPGNYTVSLTVETSNNQFGSLARQASVLPALGSLALTVEDQLGTVQRGNVRVLAFNSSSFSRPFGNLTTDSSGHVLFNQLTPGNYYLTFSGIAIVSSSKTETVKPGMTSQDTVYLAMVPSPPDYRGIIYVSTILAGLAAVSAVILYQRAKSSRRSGKGRGPSKLRSKHSISRFVYARV